MTEALYRKYRPQVFEDVVGQEHIERTLKNAIATDKVSHAYLFTGPRGTGKTTTARLLAKALLCQQGPTDNPDGTCEDCLLIADGEHPDVYELDAASRTGVDNVRDEIIGRVSYAPTRGRYKVYIIDEVHMLSMAAFNALLKTLEEPPSHVVFILCTTDPQKVPDTIHSRCQRFDFRRISNEELVSRLGAICEMEGVPFEGSALELVAHRAQGGMRDALTSLEQLIAFSEGSLTLAAAERLLGSLDSSDMDEILSAIGGRDAAACFRWTTQYMETGADLAQFTQDMAEYVRDMYVMSLTDADVALDVPESTQREMEGKLVLFGPDRLARMLGVLADLMADLKTSTNQRLSFEIALTRMIRPESDLTLASLAERVESLERNAPVGAAPAATSAPAAVAVQATAQPQPEAVPDQPAATAAAPEPAPAAAAPQAVDPSALAGRDLHQLWDSAMVHLKRLSVAHSVLFMSSHPSWDVPGEVLNIGLVPYRDFNLNAAQSPEAQNFLKEAFAQAGAPGLRFKFVNGETEEAAAGSEAAGPEAAGVRSAPAAEPEPRPLPVSAPEPEPMPEPAPVEPVQAVASEPEPEPFAVPEPDPVPDSVYEAEVVSGATPEASSEAEDETADLNSLLAGAFGADVSFTEVD